MNKIAGSFLYLWCLLLPFVCCAELSLRVVDENGESLKMVQVGRPFTIEVALTGGKDMNVSPTIQGLDQFSVEGTTWRYEMVNSETNIKFNYSVVAQKSGVFTLGPALLTHENKKEVSNALQVIVGNEQVSSSGQQEKETHPLVRLFVSKDCAVKGERLVGTLRYYYTHPSQKLRNFIEQPVEDITRKKARDPSQGTESLDGVEYNYIELDWDMYPQKAGALVVPAFGAEYEKKVKRNNILSFFGNFAEPKRIYSNAVTIQVDDLPPADRQVQGVGTLDAFALSAHPSVVMQSEGAVITAELRGDFDSDKIIFPGLQDVPKELRYYESKESTDEPSSANNPVVKRFEYIVQGLQAGSYEIPAQEFYYFDVATHSYKTLTSAPLSLTIMPGTTPSQPLAPGPSEKDIPEQLALANGQWRPIRLAVMPWWLFFLLLVIPFLVWIFKKGWQSVHMRRQKTYQARRSYQAFSLAKKQLSEIEKMQNPERLYTLFVQLFADKWQAPLAAITSESIVRRLQDIGMPAQQCEQWNSFFTELSQQAFGAQRTKQHINDLFKQAKQWLERLQQLL